MARATTAHIDLAAICHNYRLAKSLSSGQKAVAIIKANAYGHGAIPVAKALSGDADALGVACIEEAVELRNAGIEQPILLLEGFFEAEELSYISENNIWCVVHSLDQIDAIANRTLPLPITVWLKMDTGMHRLGISPEVYQQAWQRLRALPQVEQIILMSHFSSADVLTGETTTQQMQIFDRVTMPLSGDMSLANSAATLGVVNARRQWQRPGIMLYGASPFAHAHQMADKLKPAMSFTSKVIAERIVKPGDAVGYGETWQARQATKVGTVAAGYADGYPRHAKTGTPIIVNGRLSQLLGRVSMDMLAVDLSMFSESCVGMPVELWGQQLAANDVAQCADTIAYTLFCGITPRVKKVYLGTHQSTAA